MEKKENSRRKFIKQNSLIGMGALAAGGAVPPVFSSVVSDTDKPAILGGKPVRTAAWPGWPQWLFFGFLLDEKNEKASQDSQHRYFRTH